MDSLDGVTGATCQLEATRTATAAPSRQGGRAATETAISIRSRGFLGSDGLGPGPSQRSLGQMCPRVRP